MKPPRREMTLAEGGGPPTEGLCYRGPCAAPMNIALILGGQCMFPFLVRLWQDVWSRPLRAVLAVALPALTAVGFLVEAALVRGSRAEAFRVAVTAGEGHLTLLPAPGGADAPGLIAEPGPLYTHPELMRSGALVLPRVTLPVEVGAGGGGELANLRGVEPGDPQVDLLKPHLSGAWPRPDVAQVVLGADLAAALGVGVGGTVTLALARPGARAARAQVVGLVRTGRMEWDAHGAWSGLALARAVRGVSHPGQSEAATHLAVFLPDPAASGALRERLLRMAPPEPVEVREWWQLDLEPLRYAPQADPGPRWSTAMLALLAAGVAANLLLGAAPLPRARPGALPPERRVRLWVLAATAVQGLMLAACALVLAALLALTARGAIALLGSGPLRPQAFLPPGVERLGHLLPPAVVPVWRLAEASWMGVWLLVCVPLAAAVRLWRVGAQPPNRLS